MLKRRTSLCRVACATLVLALLCCGCQQGTKTQRRPRHEAAERVLSELELERLRSDLFGFGDRFAAGVNAAASDIAWQSRNRRVRELALRWKIRTIPAMQYAVFSEDPRFGLADAWVICLQMRLYFEHTDPDKTFGELQRLAFEAMQELEDDIERIARKYVPEENFDELQSELEEFAKGNPVRRGFAAGLIESSDRLAATRNPGVNSILSIPLSGLPESADAVDRLARVGAVFTEVVESLPQYSRWQVELLLMELDSLETLENALTDFDRLASSSESVAATFETLPERTREELEVALTSADASFVRVQETLDKSQEAVESLESAIAAGEQVTIRVSEAAVSLTETAEAWETTTNAMYAFVDSFRPEEPADGAAPVAEDESGGAGVQDFTRLAEEYGAAAIELRALVRELKSDELTGVITGIAETSNSSVDHAAERMSQLIDTATYRGFLLIAVLLAGLLLYGLVMIRLKARAA